MIVAGIGSIGRGLFVLGEDFFFGFDKIIAVDIEDRSQFFWNTDLPVSFFKGNISEKVFLDYLLKDISGNGIFLNVCAGVDTVKLRRQVSRYNLAYIDAGASDMDFGDCFTKLMPYTNTECHDGKPHLICQGINPGMVEMVAKIQMNRLKQSGAEKFDITIFEYDSLRSFDGKGRLAVGWNRDDFIEEMIHLPGLELREGGFILNNPRGGKKGSFVMDNQKVSCRIIGHEDVWNLGGIESVCNVKFCYGLNEKVMESLDKDEKMENLFYVPRYDEEIAGNDKIVVKVVSRDKNVSSSMLWQVNHGQIRMDFGVNGVVFQTCKSILFSLKLILDGYINRSGTYSATDIEVDERLFERVCSDLGIVWKKVSCDYAIFGV